MKPHEFLIYILILLSYLLIKFIFRKEYQYIFFFYRLVFYILAKYFLSLFFIDVFSNIGNNVEPFHFFALLLESFHAHLRPPHV